MFLTDKETIIHNAGAFYLQSRGISVTTVHTPTEVNTQHIYALDASDDLPSGLIPLVVDHFINHTYPKSLSILTPNTKYDRVCIPKATVFSMLNSNEIEITEVSNISWTKIGK